MNMNMNMKEPMHKKQKKYATLLKLPGHDLKKLRRTVLIKKVCNWTKDTCKLSGNWGEILQYVSKKSFLYEGRTRRKLAWQ